MAIVLKDRVRETTSTTGTSNFVLGGPSSGYQAFSVIGVNNFTYYCCFDNATGAWEVGYGQYTATAGGTLVRTTVLSNSAATTSKISFAAGPKDLFLTYPAEKAIYEEIDGNVLINAGPITVVGNGVTGYTTFSAALGEFYADVNSFAQMYAQNLNDGSSASTDIVAYNDLGDGSVNFIDMGIASSNYSEAAFPIFTPGSGYLYNDGGELLIGSATDDVVLFAGGVAVADEALRINKTTKALTAVGALNLGGALDVTGAAVFGSTVLLDANPTTALQAATKQYVDNQVTAGLHIHDPVRVETTGNLTATYAQGGTTFNITTITSTTTVTTSVNHGLVVNDQIWLTTTAGNGLSVNVAYFVFSVPAVNQLTLSLTFDGTQITGLTNAAGLTYATRAKSGVGATLTNSGAQAALVVDGITLSTTNRVMVRLQTAGAENGVYTVTSVGSGSTNWVLTRATDNNQVNPANPNGLGTGDYFFTQEGTLNAGDSHVLTTEPNTMIIGYTTLTYTQFSGSVDYTGGTNINITGQVISLTGTVAATNGGTGTSTVTTGDLLYGSAANTWSKLSAGTGYKALVMNAGGTQVEWNAVALNQSGAVSGALGPTNGGTGQSAYALGDILYSDATNSVARLAGNTTTTKKFLGQTGNASVSAAPVWEQPAASDITGLATSATTDTTNAANITSGTLPTARISGSYTGITGVGTLTAGTWNGTAIAANYGGTGQTVYAVGDLLYASTTTALSKLADVAVGSALISGGVSSAPSWGKIGLATHVSGTLATGNGGTGNTTGDASTVNGLTKIQMWNNSGQTHNTYQTFGAVPNFGNWFIQASNAVDAPQASSQWYTNTVGLGNEYAYSAYSLMTAISRDLATKYTWYRTRENGTWGAWGKTAAGYADTAGSAGSATNATFASSATNAGFATNATFASSATNASAATNAGFASSATNATFASSATNASAATNAGFATSAGSATNATTASSANALNSANSYSVVNLTASGTVTANSDETLKVNWRGLPADFIEQLTKVKHGTYDRTDMELTQDGISAQSLQSLLPNSVLTGADGKLSVAYGNAALVSAVELAKYVTALEQRISQLEART